MDVKQYQIVLVDLNPTKGSEINKTRPCLVVSPNEMNDNLRTVIVAPMTTSTKSYPTRIMIDHNGKRGAAAIDQIRTIDKARVLKTLGTITKDEIRKCKDVIRETFVA